MSTTCQAHLLPLSPVLLLLTCPGGNRFLLTATEDTGGIVDPKDSSFFAPSAFAPTITDIVSGHAGSVLVQLLAASCSASGHLPPSSGLAPGASASAPDLRGLNAAAAAAEIQSLERRLVELAPQLSSLAVTLKAVILPAMPWLSLEASERLQVRKCG